MSERVGWGNTQPLHLCFKERLTQWCCCLSPGWQGRAEVFVAVLWTPACCLVWACTGAAWHLGSFPHIVSTSQPEWWMGRSAPEEAPSAVGLHASSRSPEWATLTQFGRFAGSARMFRDYPPARRENCIRKRLIQFNPETKVRGKTNHWSSQVQRGDDHSAGVLSEKWRVEC